MNRDELLGWRKLWGWTAVWTGVTCAFCAAVTWFATDPNPGSGIEMGVLGACTLLSLASWAHFARKVDKES